MPSSMIFVGLVVMWLLILVPAVARHRQEVARPSVAALSGRVLERLTPPDGEQATVPGIGRNVEVDVRHEPEPSGNVATKVDPGRRTQVPGPRRAAGSRVPDADRDSFAPTPSAPDGPDGPDDRHHDRPPARYRAGRGGFDPEAAAIAARARYAFRQRVVLTLLVLAVATGLAAGFTLPLLWWAHGAVDVMLVGYLVYLRRQVRMEEAIRRRRAARMSSSRRPPVEDDDEWDAAERAVARRADARVDADDEDDEPADRRRHPSDEEPDTGTRIEHAVDDEDDGDRADDLADERPQRVAGAGEPLLLASGRGTDPIDPTEGTPALPRLQPVPPPPLPAGTMLVEADEDDPADYELDSPTRLDYRRASGE